MIEETLSEELKEHYKKLGEQNLLEKIKDAHKGKMGWLTTLMTVVNILVFIIFVYCVVQFCDVNETNELIKWACGGFLCFISMVMLKLYVWMQMDKNDILRALKKLEIQVLALSKK